MYKYDTGEHNSQSIPGKTLEVGTQTKKNQEVTKKKEYSREGEVYDFMVFLPPALAM